MICNNDRKTFTLLHTRIQEHIDVIFLNVFFTTFLFRENIDIIFEYLFLYVSTIYAQILVIFETALLDISCRFTTRQV